MTTTHIVRERFFLATMPDHYDREIHGTGEDTKAEFDAWLDDVVETAYAEGYSARGMDDDAVWDLAREWKDDND